MSIPSSGQAATLQSDPENSFTKAPWLIIITGHYGVGKTNLSLNIARDVRKVIPRVTVVDLDIVNPYFRSTDNKAFLDAHDIKVLGPVYGASNLDTPSLSPGIDEAIIDASANHAVIIDVGGDPDGARALGRFAAKIAARSYRLIHVVNLKRPETISLKDNLELLGGIEATSGLKATEILGNTHLKDLSSATDIAQAVQPTLAIAEAIGIPLRLIAAPRSLAAQVATALSQDVPETDIQVYPVDIIVGAPWEVE